MSTTISAVVKYTRPDGTTGVCVCSSRESAEKTASYYRDENDYTTTIDVWQLCGECGGDGKRPHKHNSLRSVTCTTCKGKNSQTLLETITP